MNEDKVIGQLRSVGADGIISLPCDKNKLLTDMLHLEFDVVDVTREEDAVGISAGMAMAGKRPVISIQSSGLGNMLNAMMSLTGCYRLPMFVLASWRGTESEKIEAQVHFNSRIPELLEVYGIGCSVVESEEDIHLIGEAMKDSFDRSVMNVVLVKPDLWGDSKRLPQDYPTRRRIIPAVQAEEFPEPELTRLEAIKEVMAMVGAIQGSARRPRQAVELLHARELHPGHAHRAGPFALDGQERVRHRWRRQPAGIVGVLRPLVGISEEPDRGMSGQRHIRFNRQPAGAGLRQGGPRIRGQVFRARRCQEGSFRRGDP